MTFLNSGPEHALTPAFSYTVACKDQAEIDHYWEKLLEGGKPMACGWLAGKILPVLADRAGEDWRDPEASQSDGCDDEDGEVRHRYAGGRGEGVTANGERAQNGKGLFPIATPPRCDR